MRVVYEYHCDVEGAGNVSRIRRMTPTGQPDEYTVAGTSFAYNKMSELWITSHRTWDEVRTTQGGIDVTVNNLVVKDIVEFRGVGRQRWMMRARDTTAPYDPDPDTAVWTDYASNAPLYDYTVSFDTATPPNITENHKDYYSLGMAQMDETGVVMYTHANHLGSTRAMTNEATPPTVQRTFTYTAFGEIVGEAGTFETRYQYAGGNGNETFGEVAPNFPFPFVHTRSRWYDPETGRYFDTRFSNFFSTIVNRRYYDRHYVRKDNHSWVYFENEDGSFSGYALRPAKQSKKGVFIVPVPGDVQDSTPGEKLPRNARRYPSTPEEDRADRNAIERQKNDPPSYSIHGIGPSMNCIGWARYWATRREKRNEAKVCFVGGTVVHTPSGTVPIEEITARDSVWTTDLAAPTRRLEREVHLVNKPAIVYDIVAIEIPGETIRCTPPHAFWVVNKNAWVHARELQPGDEILGIDGAPLPIHSVSNENYPAGIQVYNFKVREHHYYFVGERGVLVENGILK